MCAQLIVPATCSVIQLTSLSPPRRRRWRGAPSSRASGGSSVRETPARSRRACVLGHTGGLSHQRDRLQTLRDAYVVEHPTDRRRRTETATNGHLAERPRPSLAVSGSVHSEDHARGSRNRVRHRPTKIVWPVMYAHRRWRGSTRRRHLVGGPARAIGMWLHLLLLDRVFDPGTIDRRDRGPGADAVDANARPAYSSASVRVRFCIPPC